MTRRDMVAAHRMEDTAMRDFVKNNTWILLVVAFAVLVAVGVAMS